jgi:starch synthase (maltosyl-transferring)
MVVNLDHENTQTAWVQLDLVVLGIEPNAAFQVEDLLTDATYTWTGEWNYVALDPAVMPAHIFRIVR